MAMASDTHLKCRARRFSLFLCRHFEATKRRNFISVTCVRIYFFSELECPHAPCFHSTANATGAVGWLLRGLITIHAIDQPIVRTTKNTRKEICFASFVFTSLAPSPLATEQLPIFLIRIFCCEINRNYYWNKQKSGFSQHKLTRTHRVLHYLFINHSIRNVTESARRRIRKWKWKWVHLNCQNSAEHFYRSSNLFIMNISSPS